MHCGGGGGGGGSSIGIHSNFVQNFQGNYKIESRQDFLVVFLLV